MAPSAKAAAASASRSRSRSRTRSNNAVSSSKKSTTTPSNGHSTSTVSTTTPSKSKSSSSSHRTPISFVWVLLAVSCMVIVPLFVYWCWMCVEYHGGRLWIPSSFTSSALSQWEVEFVRHLKEAVPSFRAWAIYGVWIVMQVGLYQYAPGPEGFGPVLEDGKRLKYRYNGQFAFFTSIALVVVLHYTKVFRLSELYTLFPQMLTVCIVWTFGVILFLYVHAALHGLLYRRTTSHLYDYFMGPRLNPRFGTFDVKFFFELRPGIMHWFFTSVGILMMQIERDQTFSWPMVLVCFYHLCFVNSCYKGEQCVPFSMDIVYEKFGWMLLMLDIVMVPFIFPMQAYFLLKTPIDSHLSNPYVLGILFFLHCFGYFMFDTANAQKDYFREKDQPENHIPKGFPRLPWSDLKNPPYLRTKRGTKLLLGGWWGLARHMNYTGDILMSWVWGLTCGIPFVSPVWSYFPFAYTTYLTPLLLHRERRDDRTCQEKYGQDWTEYKKKVPYRLVPFVY